jgi:hypothetical protein
MTSLPVTAFDVVKDDKTGSYDAIVGDREVGALTYDVAGEHRLVLLAHLGVPRVP